MSNLFDLKDKTIVITGGGGVLCGTMALKLAEAGAKVAVLDLLEAAAAKVADKINTAGGQAIAVKCNVAGPAIFRPAERGFAVCL